MAIDTAADERPGSLEDPGPAPADDREVEADWYDFDDDFTPPDPNDRWADEDAAVESAERHYEQWLGRT